MDCPACNKKLNAIEIKEKQVKYGLLEKVACPHCAKGLYFRKAPQLLRILGIALIAAGAFANMLVSTQNQLYFSVMVFAGALLAVIGTYSRKPEIHE